MEPKATRAEYIRDWKRKNADRVRETAARWRANNQEKVKAYSRKHAERIGREGRASRNRKTRYGLDEGGFKSMLEKQNGMCAICGSPAEVVDHNHGDGSVRGLLCRNCNLGIGYFKDSTALLRSAALYLTQSAERAA